jgi:hypothetical protein
MMRTKTGFVCVVAALAVGACSWGSGSGSSSPGPDASFGGGNAVCGDNVCASSEVGNCPADCGNSGSNNPQAVCGNHQCETTLGESATSCPTDCATGSGGGSNTGSGGNTSLDCNDQATQFGCLLCTLGGQCTPPYDVVSCAACGGGGGCVGGLPNGVCDPGEDANNCPFDCM